MKILHVTSGYPPTIGGVERHVQDLSVALSRLGHQVTIAAADGGALPASELRDGIPVYRFASVGRGVYRFPLGLAGFLRSHARDFDIVHAHNVHALPLLAAVLLGGASVVISPYYHGHGHSRLASLLHRVYVPAIRRPLRRAAGAVCLSASEAALVAQAFGIPRSTLRVVPSIVERPAGGAEATPGRPGPAARGRVVLCVGRLEPYKRVDRAVAALAHLPADVRLVIVGGGPERAALERQVGELGLRARVTFAGRVSDADLGDWYRRAAAVVTFSEAESFGRTVVEALAYGCRVIGTDCAVFHEFAADYPQTVTLVPASAGAPADAAAIGRALAWGEPARVDLSRFSAASVAEQLVGSYERAIVGRPRAGVSTV